MGSGKSRVLAECGDLLLSRGIAHAAIHLDTLATVHFPADLTDDPDVRLREHGVMYRNPKALSCWTSVAVFERNRPSGRCLATLDDLAWLTGGTGEQGTLLLENAAAFTREAFGRRQPVDPSGRREVRLNAVPKTWSQGAEGFRRFSTAQARQSTFR
jgi:hypothetical protein